MLKNLAPLNIIKTSDMFSLRPLANILFSIKPGTVTNCARFMSASIPIDHKDFPDHRSLSIENYGEPVDNVILKVRKPADVLPDELGPEQVLVEHLQAPVNPADINLIQGVYGKKPKLPTIVGNEGVTRVRKIGTKVKHLKPGDIALGVLINTNWQSYSVQKASTFYKVTDGLDITIAAQLKVNPCTAYRMIKDFHQLNAGDTIIQNGANSAVGVYVIQLAKLWGYKTINVIRDRPNRDEVVKELKDFGADIVLTEADITNVEVVKPILNNLGKPKLFLNCVGGRNAINCQKTLDAGGYSITYGAMSKQPFSVTATSLIFKDHKYLGFWVSRWYQERELSNRHHEIDNMLTELGGLFEKGILKPKATTLIDFEDRNIAFSGSNNTKYLFAINK